MTTTEVTPRVERAADDSPVFVHECGVAIRSTTLPLGEPGQGYQWMMNGGLMPFIRCGECGIIGYWVGSSQGSPYWRPI